MTYQDRNFIWLAIFYSALAHLIFITALSIVHTSRIVKPSKTIHVTYQKGIANPIKPTPIPNKEIKVLKKEEPVEKFKLDMDKPQSSPFSGEILKDLTKSGDDFKVSKKDTTHVATLDMERRIFIPMMHAEKISNPKYVDYTDGIRGKIKRRVIDTLVDEENLNTGEVYLTFIVASDGTIKAVKIIESKTKANSFMRKLCIRSIQEAGPFPRFPTDLNYPELTFNIVIQYKQ